MLPDTSYSNSMTFSQISSLIVFNPQKQQKDQQQAMSESNPKVPLLGKTYRHQDYSHSFNSMVNRVVTRIYLRKGRKKMFNPPVICPNFNQEEEARNTSAYGGFGNRKNSPNRTAHKFFSTPRSSKIEQNSSILSLANVSVKLQNSACQGGQFRCVTDPINAFKVKLNQKIEQNNRCLKVRSFKVQEKGCGDGERAVQTVRFKRTKKETYSFRDLPLKNRNGLNKTVMRAHCPTHEQSSPIVRSTSLPIAFNDQFRPWETQEGDEMAFF